MSAALDVSTPCGTSHSTRVRENVVWCSVGEERPYLRGLERQHVISGNTRLSCQTTRFIPRNVKL
jgi:hypothetical protein